MQTKSAVIRSMIIAGPFAAMLAAPALAGGPTTAAPEPVIIPAAEPYVAPGIDWSGAYAGAQIGYADTDTTGGALDGCYIITERGGDYGFGAATVQLAQYFRMAPVSQSGQPTEGAMVRLPMVWKLN